jgi:THO complex subunit 4
MTRRPRALKYDRSGRSSGTATVAFETLAEATRARNQYDGILAKGASAYFIRPAAPRATFSPLS